MLPQNKIDNFNPFDACWDSDFSQNKTDINFTHTLPEQKKEMDFKSENNPKEIKNKKDSPFSWFDSPDLGGVSSS